MTSRSALFLCVIVLGAVACGQKTDMADDPLQKARTLAEEGNYDEALRQHVWLHDHVLEERPAYYGVRLSFALHEWVRLGQSHPPALQELKRIRGAKTARLQDGERDHALFHDVAAINSALGESAATVVLFKELDADDSAFAGKVRGLAEDALVEAGEHDLVKKHLGPPEKHFEALRRGLEEGLRHAETSAASAASRQAFESIYTEGVVRLLTVLDHTGDKAEALRIQQEALKVLDRPEIRQAVRTE